MLALKTDAGSGALEQMGWRNIARRISQPMCRS